MLRKALSLFTVPIKPVGGKTKSPAWLWALTASPLVTVVSVTAGAAMLPLSVPVPVPLPVRAVPVAARPAMAVIVCVSVAGFALMTCCARACTVL